LNAILERVLAGEYSAGLERYAMLRAPSADDDRFAGACLYNLQKLQEAKNLLLRARARGCAAAGIELATVWRQLGHLELSREVLEQVELSGLSGFDRALALRELGVHAYAAGDLAGASELLERAWMAAFEAPEGSSILPAIGQASGLVYASRGLDRQAAESFQTALEGANEARLVHLRANRALCLCYLGRFEAAENDLELAVQGVELVPLAAPYLRYVAGVLHWSRGELVLAERLFAEASDLASQGSEPETECYAQLGRCAVATAMGRLAEARGHLARARQAPLNRKAHAVTQLREGALLARCGDDGAAAILQRALDAFVELGLVREQAWTWIHLAEAELRSGRTARAEEALTQATVSRFALGDGAPLAIELRLAPAALDLLARAGDASYLKVLHRDLQSVGGEGPVRIELVTLGRSELLVDGTRARLDLRRSIEVLAYLLARPETTLAQVLVDLFPDEDPEHARSYFHQVRYELARTVRGLSVPFDTRTKTYRVRCRGPELVWDVETVKRALAGRGEDGLLEALSRCGGQFLPGADSEWARAEGDELVWSLVKLGLEVIEELYVQGRYDRCLSLAGRLLEIDPYDEVVNEWLVKAAQASEGEHSARRLAARLARRFKRELGIVPPGLVRPRPVN
jgi:tetratricopeptide (TPR) repeat protein/DNA-binding SARP family transcriptional activator